MSTFFSLDLTDGYPNTGGVHDIQFDAGGSLKTVTDGEAVAQRVRQHIEFYQGEWFLDTEVGVPWFQFIFVEPFDQSTAETFLKAEILDVEGVAEITEFVVSVDKRARSFNLTRVTIRTDFNDEVKV